MQPLPPSDAHHPAYRETYRAYTVASTAVDDTNAIDPSPASDAELADVDRYWRAANYLSAAQIYLRGNPLLRERLSPKHVKPRLLGHWGTCPGLNLVYAHLNRAIVRHDLNAIFIAGPGHGGPAVVANAYLEGSYTEHFPEVSQDIAGLTRLVRQFSSPGGIPSHASPDTPGSLHEGGELGYSLAHAYGATFDNPDLLAVCVVGDGEAETGALAASWHSNKFVNPVTDGAVLPVLHLNGYKIASPTILASIPLGELDALFRGYGFAPLYVEGDDPLAVHRRMSVAVERCVREIADIQTHAREGGHTRRPAWPMIIMRTPKGWTGPAASDGHAVEGTHRAHQVPIVGVREHPARLAELEDWLRGYGPEELFDATGAPVEAITHWLPHGGRRMGSNPVAKGGPRRQSLELPRLQDYQIAFDQPGRTRAEATRQLGAYLREVIVANPSSFRLFGPDETTSNRLGDVFEVTNRVWTEPPGPTDEAVAREGRVMEVLSEQLCQGWLEGYLLTGRHGLFSCYEAFVHVVASMFNQHAKWLDTSRDVAWRTPLPSLNYLLTSHVWRQDHNGFSHQDPGFLDLVLNKKSDVVRVYLPPDANTLLCVADHCLRTYHRVNVIVAGKQPSLQYMNMAAAEQHVCAGASAWAWASTHCDERPDVVLASAGDVPTQEVLAAAELLRGYAPDLKVRVVNVVDLMRLCPPLRHPHGLSAEAFAELFPPGVPVVFAFHGYPDLIHRLTYDRDGHEHWEVRGFEEEGTTTTPFDMVVRNRLDRFSLVERVAESVGALAPRRAALTTAMRGRHDEHRAYIRREGEDMPDILSWEWRDGRHDTKN